MEKREITLKECFSVVWKSKLLILLSTIIVLVVTIIGSIIYNTRTATASTIVSLEWDGITDGKYPDGTNFNYNNLFELSIINKALEKNDLFINTNSVRDAISITPIIPTNVAKNLQKSLETGEKISYYSTNYKISLNYDRLNLTKNQGIELLDSIITSYSEYFQQKYITNSSILNLVNEDFNNFEYLDSLEILMKQAQIIENIINVKLKASPNFYSTNLNIGFNDILIRTELVKNIKINNISSKIDTYALAKDKDYLISKYTYEIKMMELNLAKSQAKVSSLETMIANYSGNTQTILIPGMDPSQVLKIDTYYDSLIKELVTYQYDIAHLQNDKTFKELQIDRIKGIDPNNSYTPEEQTAVARKVEDEIASTKLILNEIINDSNDLLTEYKTIQTHSIIKPLMVSEYESKVNILINSIIGLAVGFGLGVIIVLFRNKWD